MKRNTRSVDGELVVGGNKGQIVYREGTVPETWGDAIMFRTANQGNLKAPWPPHDVCDATPVPKPNLSASSSSSTRPQP